MPGENMKNVLSQNDLVCPLVEIFLVSLECNFNNPGLRETEVFEEKM